MEPNLSREKNAFDSACHFLTELGVLKKTVRDRDAVEWQGDQVTVVATTRALQAESPVALICVQMEDQGQ